MRLPIGVLVLLLVSTLGGCAGMSEQACLVTDWRSVGFEDGVAGRSPGSIASYRQSCSKYGVTPNLDQYLAGHGEGVRSYCGTGNGFEVGRRGQRYFGVCPADLEPDFLDAYNQGHRLYELEAAVRSIDNQIAARYRRLDELKKSLAATSLMIVSDETEAKRRAELLIDAAAMAKEQGTISKEIEALESEKADREAELYDFRQTLAFAF
jgi:hypothetical protein